MIVGNSEQEAIKAVIALAEQHGYGNLINRLKTAWSEKLQGRGEISREAADTAAGLVCVWCKVDSRTGKKLKKV